VASFPCLDRFGHYRGCIGIEACKTQGQQRCWSGHKLTLNTGGRILGEVRVQRQLPSDCATCANVVLVDERRETGHGRRNLELLACGAGLWTGYASRHNYVHGLIPLRQEGFSPCPMHVQAEQLREEVVRDRQKRAERARERRRRAREQREQESIAA
jgi:hypothetical protein